MVKENHIYKRKPSVGSAGVSKSVKWNKIGRDKGHRFILVIRGRSTLPCIIFFIWQRERDVFSPPYPWPKLENSLFKDTKQVLFNSGSLYSEPAGTSSHEHHLASTGAWISICVSSWESWQATTCLGSSLTLWQHVSKLAWSRRGCCPGTRQRSRPATSQSSDRPPRSSPRTWLEFPRRG